MSFHPPMVVPYPQSEKYVTKFSGLPRGWEYYINQANKLVFRSDTSQMYTFNDPRLPLPAPGSEVEWIFEDPEDTMRFVENQRTGQPTFQGSIFDTRDTGPDEHDDIPDLISEARGYYNEENSRDPWEGNAVGTGDGWGLTEEDRSNPLIQKAIEESTMGISENVSASEEHELGNGKQGHQEGLDNKTESANREDVRAVRDQEWDEWMRSKYVAWQEKYNTSKADRSCTEAEKLAELEGVPQEVLEQGIIEWNEAKPTMHVLEEHYAGLIRTFRRRNSGWVGTGAREGKDKEGEGKEDFSLLTACDDEDDDVDENILLDEDLAMRVAIQASLRDQERGGESGDDGAGKASGCGSRKGKETERGGPDGL